MADGSRERAAVLALSHSGVASWYEVAETVEAAGSALRIVHGDLSALELVDASIAAALANAVTDLDVDRWGESLDALLDARPDLALRTVLDEDYPLNLREIYDRPPFVFIRGALAPVDDTAIAVVGTRQASTRGVEEARALATSLARRGVTVVSGLARGIDTAAHTAALDAGGRTVAILGCGITRVYPAENAPLADRIAANGAVVSQFAPDAPPRRANFPIRNRVTSGIAVGTAVVEASATSGARMQARLALEHGKRLFLLETLVMQQDWARDYAARPGTIVVHDVDEILDVLDHRPAYVEQLRLA